MDRHPESLEKKPCDEKNWTAKRGSNGQLLYETSLFGSSKFRPVKNESDGTEKLFLVPFPQVIMLVVFPLVN